MPRRRRPETREILPDPVYNSTLAEKFVNSMMWDGKKAVSQKIFYDAMDKIKERSRRRSVEAVQEGGRELQAAAGSEDAARGRRQLSGSGGSAAEPPHQSGDPLDSDQCPFAAGKGHAGEAGERIERRRQSARRRNQEERRRSPHGGSQQGFRALPLVEQS